MLALGGKSRVRDDREIECLEDRAELLGSRSTSPLAKLRHCPCDL